MPAGLLGGIELTLPVVGRERNRVMRRKETATDGRNRYRAMNCAGQGTHLLASGPFFPTLPG